MIRRCNNIDKLISSLNLSFEKLAFHVRVHTSKKWVLYQLNSSLYCYVLENTCYLLSIPMHILLVLYRFVHSCQAEWRQVRCEGEGCWLLSGSIFLWSFHLQVAKWRGLFYPGATFLLHCVCVSLIFVYSVKQLLLFDSQSLKQRQLPSGLTKITALSVYLQK